MGVDPFIHEVGNSQGINPYSYVMNNPLGYTDPSGYSASKTDSICENRQYCGNAFGFWKSGQKAESKENNGASHLASFISKGVGQDIVDWSKEIGDPIENSDVENISNIVSNVQSRSTNVSPTLGQQGLSLGLDVAPVIGGIKGFAQVYTEEDLVTGEKLNRWEESGYAVLGLFGLKGVAKAGDIADFGEASLKVLRQGDNLPSPVNFKGLVQNRNLQDLTHQDLTKAFDGTGFTLSNHAINRLKHPRTRDLGFGNLNDISKVFNKGARFDAGGGEIGFSYRGLEAIVNPKTNNVVTFRPEKLRR